MLAALDMDAFDITNPGLVDGVDIDALKTDVDEFPAALKNLLTAEINQLENIGANTITTPQWSFLGSVSTLALLTNTEITQLLNINTTTLSAAQWAYLGAQTGRVGMTDRGDPAAADFTQATLTVDGAWHDLDLSGIVPVGAKTVLLRLSIDDNAINHVIGVAEQSVSNFVNIYTLRTTVANVFNQGDCIVALNGNRKVQYVITAATNTIVITVAGWWFE